MRPRKDTNRIILHCSATRPGWMKDASFEDRVAEIRRWHVDERGWSDIGYHYLVDRDGTVLPGRDEALMGAHTVGHNHDSIGICLLGGHGSSADDRFEQNFTPEQKAAVQSLIIELRATHGWLGVHGHNEFAAKACPGFRVRYYFL